MISWDIMKLPVILFMIGSGIDIGASIWVYWSRGIEEIMRKIWFSVLTFVFCLIVMMIYT
jgi:DMSO reductase anchor subunit